MAILESPFDQLRSTNRYKYVRGVRGFAIGSADGPKAVFHNRLKSEVQDEELPLDAGLVIRTGVGLHWFGMSATYYSYGIPRPGEREKTLLEAEKRFPEYQHSIADER